MSKFTTLQNLFKATLFFFIFSSFSTNLYAANLAIDNFDNPATQDGWSRDDGYYGYLQLNRHKTSKKTYSFGSSYANASVKVEIYFILYKDWEFNDEFKLVINGTKYYAYGTNQPSVSYSGTLPTTLDSNGELSISVSALSNKSSERAYIDYVKIISDETAPNISPAAFTIYKAAPKNTIVGTISSTGSPNTFTILSGNTDNIFGVSNNGDIYVASASKLSSTTQTSYTLEIKASNSYGYDVEYFTINITDDIALSTADINTRDFTNVPLLGKNSITINGSILQIGNQLLCKNSSDGATCEAPPISGYTQNNYYYQHKARIDTSTGAPLSNTMAKLSMQAGDKVVYAGLYWSARITDRTSAEKISAQTIQIKGPQADSYTAVTSYNAKYNWYTSGRTTDYVASQDVTDYVASQGAGDYYVGGITATNGTGNYASWELVVIVENPDRSLKNIALYDGFYEVFNGSGYPSSASAYASGFITPTNGDPFDASLFLYTGESDDGYGDSVELQKLDGSWEKLKDGANDTGDVANASVYSPDYNGSGYRSAIAGMADPNFKNVLGVDIDKLKINDKLDSSKQILSSTQTSTQIRISSSGDRFTLNMFAFETEVFVPEFCYDYAYSQHDKYFTEDNDGTQSPYLKGDVTAHEPIKMTIFIKSLVDPTMQVDNMSIDVDEINASQASYIDGTAAVARVGELTATPASVTSGTLNGYDYIHNIEIGSLYHNDYIYAYYQLDPSVSQVNMPIKVAASYDLTLDSTTVPYTLKLSKDIPMCTNSNFEYVPAKGEFNIVHNNYYNLDTGGSSGYYNLPTQVTNREGNFKAIILDSNNLDVLLPNHPITVAAVDMIDAGSFHFTDASCKESTSSISPRVWLVFDANKTSVPFNQAALQNAIAEGRTTLATSTDYYTQARQNAAFRISYNYADKNGSLIELQPVLDGSSVRYNVANFPDLIKNGNCNQDMDGNPNSTDTVSGYCSNAGASFSSAMTPAELSKCMECVYGYQTKVVCSQDNFSIRPEAFMLNIDDVDQDNQSTQQRLTTGYSGSVGSTAPNVDLAAGYNYNIEVNATNHINNTSSPGYTRTMNTSTNEKAQYIFEPRNGITTSGCNDTNDKNVSMRFLHGNTNVYKTLDQVGEYRLTIADTSWTTIDSTYENMKHHVSGPFLRDNNGIPIPDCVLDSNVTQPINSSSLNGCNISSNHYNPDNQIQYNDFNLTFHPYSFNLSDITPSVGVNKVAITANSYIYMEDVTNDNNMSVHFNGEIKAIGYDNSVTSNFVNNCYAKPISVFIDKSDTNTAAYQYLINIFDKDNNNIRNSTGDLNNTNPPVTMITSDFPTNQLGTAKTSLNVNFNRNASNPINPQAVTINTYEVNCTLLSDCEFNADLTTQAPTGKQLLDATIKHYYGRSHAPRQKFVGSGVHNANMFYEIYCSGEDCNKSLLPDGDTSTYNDDPRWFINTAHTSAFGTAGNVEQKGSSAVTVSTQPTGAAADTAAVEYDASHGYPYITTMENNASNWLIYNPFDATATKNDFVLEFYLNGSGYVGTGESEGSVDPKRKSSTTEMNRNKSWW